MSATFLNRVKGYDASSSEFDLRGFLGSAFSADWRQALVARGFAWHMDTVATFATPITGGGAGTTMDLDQPEFGISVPSGYCLIPLRVRIAVFPGVSTADNDVTEACLLLDRTAAYAGDGTVVSQTPINLRTDTASGCEATVFAAATGDITDPVVSAILDSAVGRANFGDATGMTIEHLDLLYEPANPPLIVGPAAIYGYWGGTIAATGYGQATFAVIASSLVTGLS